jgi:hypothetical protein
MIMTTIIKKKSRLNCNICKFYANYSKSIQVCVKDCESVDYGVLIGFERIVNKACNKFKINKVQKKGKML